MAKKHKHQGTQSPYLNKQEVRGYKKVEEDHNDSQFDELAILKEEIMSDNKLDQVITSVEEMSKTMADMTARLTALEMAKGDVQEVVPVKGMKTSTKVIIVAGATVAVGAAGYVGYKHFTKGNNQEALETESTAGQRTSIMPSKLTATANALR